MGEMVFHVFNLQYFILVKFKTFTHVFVDNRLSSVKCLLLSFAFIVVGFLVFFSYNV